MTPFFQFFVDDELYLQINDSEAIDSITIGALIVQIMQGKFPSPLKTIRRAGDRPPEISFGQGALNELKALYTARCLVEELRYLGVTAIPVDTQS